MDVWIDGGTWQWTFYFYCNNKVIPSNLCHSIFFSTVEVSAGSSSHILTTGLKECADNGVPGGLLHARLPHLRDLLDFPGLIGFGLNEIWG